jgi:hypothetical protein
LATKKDIHNLELELKIEQSRNQMIVWVASILGGFGVFFLGILAKGFHWI